MKRATYFVHSILLSLAVAMPCLAQEAAKEEEAVKSYVMSYFIVGLGVALGLIAVCRSSNRRKDVRRPE